MSTDATSGSIYSAPESETSTTGADDLFAVYVGPKNAEYYKARFEKIAGGSSIGWHWPAFFFTSAWLLYRKMWLYALLYMFVVPTILSVVTMLAFDPVTGVTAYYIIYGVYGFILMPLFANRLYYGHVKTKVDKVSSLNMSEAQVAQELARKGGTSWVAFIFIIIPILGILAAIAIPAYQDYTLRAQVSEGMSMSQPVKAMVAEYYRDNGALPASNAEAGLGDPESYSGTFVTSITIVNGEIVAEFGGSSVNALLRGQTITQYPSPVSDSTLEWGCYSDTLEGKWLPAACR